MKKKPKKYVLTLTMQGKELEQLEIIKKFFGEKTGAKAIRSALDALPGKFKQVEQLDKELSSTLHELEIIKEAGRVLAHNLNILSGKKMNKHRNL